MNQFFFETRGKEKIQELREEGMRSQATRRSRSSNGMALSLPKLILISVAVLTILSLLGY